MGRKLHVGMDVGSTTVKMVVLNESLEPIFKKYVRHFADIKGTVLSLFTDVKKIIEDQWITVSVAGSAGLMIAENLDLPFVQEVIACKEAIEKLIPNTDVAIELGGEDAKITYLSSAVEQRMNGTCAGGTGAFIDQMATLLKTDAAGLNELAKEYKNIYPIASRCGVFAKTDIQPLLNEGASKEDIAASIFQAVVNQTISGLAQGRPIKGRVAFLGGPLYFLSQLRERFIQTLALSPEQILFPEDAQYFVAIGSAIMSMDQKLIACNELYKNLEVLGVDIEKESTKLEPLFQNEQEYLQFRKRHEKHRVECFELAEYQGKAFLGIDAGSTTTKIVLIDEIGRLLYSYYGSNEGSPLESTLEGLKELYSQLHSEVQITYSAVTGYGEHLIKAALRLDEGEIETVAHYKAAQFFIPDVDFILDIGGQDMKSLQIRNGVIESIMLNEACSSGCGSFIESFAHSLGFNILDFAKAGIIAKHPVDLGTRCTVFMNSKVKQAQKDGAQVADIAAGIAISVIKNALFKVIRLRNVEDLGKKIVVQGGTFYNDAVLRALEQIIGKEVVRPNISGMMGAFGAALIAKERFIEGIQSNILTGEALEKFNTEVTMKRCELCGNHCLMSIHRFSNGGQFVTGNRCERGEGVEKKASRIPNLYMYKYKRAFDYQSLSMQQAKRGTIGIPRVLNLYEDYPFWFTLFTTLGYRVILSGRSSKKLFEKGMDTIPSESACYPAKLVHGHIVDLVERGVDKIFYPCIPYNDKEDSTAQHYYNCPIVTSYPEAIRANMQILKEKNVEFYYPFLPIHKPNKLLKRLKETLKEEKIPAAELKKAVEKAYNEWQQYKKDIQKEGEKVLQYIRSQGIKGIVLCGRPYHIDPEIHHGIPEMIQSFGFAVLTEDSIAHLGQVERPMRIVDQWVYHSRMYRASSFVAAQKDLEIIQLNSFGCGLDAVTTDQVKEILEGYGKIYTVLKIDEIHNLGAARIRVRSLMAALQERDRQRMLPQKMYKPFKRVTFTSEMKKKHTILSPQMAPIHFQFLQTCFQTQGYQLEILPSVDKEAMDEGLKYVHNDACYPSILVVGQIMKALKSGQYDLNQTSVIISQTGGGCRATNYIGFIRRALQDAGMEQVPVISLNAYGMEKNPGFTLSLKLIDSLFMGLTYGDLLMRLLYRVRPYEKVIGSANDLYNEWVNRCLSSIRSGDRRDYKQNIYNMVKEFDQLAINEEIQKPKVGIVGEILVKFHPTANNNIVDLLEKEGAEVVVPDLTDFFLYCCADHYFQHDLVGGTLIDKFLGRVGVKFIEHYRKPLVKALRESRRFTPPKSIFDIAKEASKHISLGHQTGEGWFLTGEMIELIHSGVYNILCLQPFACLPNHVTGKGMIKELRDHYPLANIVPIDYDPGASEVNQINRIKLMLATAFKNLA